MNYTVMFQCADSQEWYLNGHSGSLESATLEAARIQPNVVATLVLPNAKACAIHDAQRAMARAVGRAVYAY